MILRHRRLKERQGLIVQLCEGNQQGWGEIAPLPEFSQESLEIAEQQAKQWLKAWLAEQNDDVETCVPSVAFGLSCALAGLNGELGEQGNFKTAPLWTPSQILCKHPFQLNGARLGEHQNQS